MVKPTPLCDVFDSPVRFRQWIIKGATAKRVAVPLNYKNVTVNYALPYVGERGNYHAAYRRPCSSKSHKDLILPPF